MNTMKCPYCECTNFEKYVPKKGNKMFIGCADTNTKTIYSDTGFICDLYVCKSCGNVHLQLEK